MEIQIQKREQEINKVMNRILGWCLIVILILAMIKPFVAPKGYYASLRGIIYSLQWVFVLIPYLSYKKIGKTGYYKHLALMGMQLCNMSLYMSSWIYGAIVGIITIYLAALYDDRRLIIKYILINTGAMIGITLLVTYLDYQMQFIVNMKSMMLFMTYVVIQVVALGIIMLVGSETNRSLGEESRRLTEIVENNLIKSEYTSTMLQQSVKILSQKLLESTTAIQMINEYMGEIVYKTQQGLEELEQIKKWMTNARNQVGQLYENTEVIVENTGIIGAQVTVNQERIKSVVDEMNSLQTINRQSEKILTTLNNQMCQINHTLEFINKVSNQTDLLSLNARIEAARAGEMGVGFGVVAVEIQKLANESNKASQEIEQNIAEMNKSIEDTIRYIQSIHSRIGDNNTSIKVIAGEYITIYEMQKGNSLQVKEVSNVIGGIEGESRLMEEQIGIVASKNKVNLESVTYIAAGVEEITANLSEIAEQTDRIYQMSEGK